MRVVSIGDLVLDYYYKNGKLLGINGGMTAHNIIANLAKMNVNTSVFSVCGDDLQGEVAIKSLEILKVDVKNISILNGVRTRCFHVSYFDDGNTLTFASKKRCPFCNNKKWYDDSLINPDEILKNINDDDVLVFDNLNCKNQILIDNTNNKKVIDLGQYFELENLSSKEIVKKIKAKFEIINFNERVSNYLVKKLKLNDNIELYKTLNPNLMTITHGEKGASFIFNDKEYHFNLCSKGNVVDSTGAGDAFFACVIKDWIKNNFNYDSNLFEKWYENSNKLTFKVVCKMGSRGHINPLFKIRQIDNVCTCENFLYHERKKIKRCNININNLKVRIINSIHSRAVNKLETISFNENSNCLFIGTGGSYAGAYFASKIINLLYGANTYPMYPRDVLYRNNKNIDKVILFSYSGTTNDIINSVKTFDKDNVYVVTKGELQNIVMKTSILKKNVLSYRTSSNKGKERGFLAFEGALSPAAIFLKYYLEKTCSSINLDDFIQNRIGYWNEKIGKIINKEWVSKIKEHGIINIFRGDFTDSACYDLESKIIESGLFNVIMHEKKNFSHGRFINYENLRNTFSLYFKQNLTTEYERELLKYLGDGALVIESEYEGILAEFDLLIASQFIIYHIGNVLNVDVSKPKYSSLAMKIYFYKGNL